MISVKYTEDLKEIEPIMFDKELMHRTMNYDAYKYSIKTFKKAIAINMRDENTAYLIIYKDSIPIGMSYIHPFKRNGMEYHFSILKEYREKYAWFANKKCMLWVKNNIKHKDLWVRIPHKYLSTIKFAIKSGFKLQYIKFNEWWDKSKNKYDVYYMYKEIN